MEQLEPREGVLLPQEATDQQDPPSPAGRLLQLEQGGRDQFPRPLLRRRQARTQGGNSVRFKLSRPFLVPSQIIMNQSNINIHHFIALDKKDLRGLYKSQLD